MADAFATKKDALEYLDPHNERVDQRVFHVTRISHILQSTTCVDFFVRSL